jgi:hypothetical protein
MKLSMQTIQEVDDGRIAAAFNIALERAIADLDDRGADKKTRKIALTVTLKPVVQEGQVEEIEADFQVITKTPALQSRTYRMQPRGGKSLLFNAAAPENANQGTLDDLKPGDAKPKPKG